MAAGILKFVWKKMQQTNNTYPFYGPEDIKRYLSGSMSAQEMHDMEKAALKDPLLADAIDGFRNADPVTTDNHLNAIKASILGLAHQEPVVLPLHKTPKTYWWRWAAAACSLTLIAGATWWITQKAESDLKAVAHVEPIQHADTTQTAAPKEPVTTVAEQPQLSHGPVAQNNEPQGGRPYLKKDRVPPKTALALVEAAQPVPPQKMNADEAIQPKTGFSSEPKATKDNLVNYNYNSRAMETAPSVSSAAVMAQNANRSTFNKAMALQPVAYIQGQVVDKEGVPLPNASISVPGRSQTTANNDGSFVLPVYDSSFNVSVNMIGYQNATAFLKPGQQNKVVLEKNFNSLEETIIIGNASNLKKRTVYMRDARKAQAEAASANEVIYPEEGWSHFYEELGTSLGVDKAKKTKTLQIKFTVDDNGDPVDFEVVESPDAILAKKAIEFIKKAKWKNFKLDKNALVKIEVN
jgi:hypothetical protein